MLAAHLKCYVKGKSKMKFKLTFSLIILANFVTATPTFIMPTLREPVRMYKESEIIAVVEVTKIPPPAKTGKYTTFPVIEAKVINAFKGTKRGDIIKIKWYIYSFFAGSIPLKPEIVHTVPKKGERFRVGLKKNHEGDYYETFLYHCGLYKVKKTQKRYNPLSNDELKQILEKDTKEVEARYKAYEEYKMKKDKK